ncbi:MAG: hypothetical protein PHH01_03985 [Patescibacteria group bacterium]|nr:hypothetical protein [Patescibacteria group bacterium]MDD5567327.1 hypothetical protein [Patescibacteria group bacterium]
MANFTQKTIEQFFQEYSVPEDKREKVLMSVTPLVYDRNQHVIKWEKAGEEEEKKKIEILIVEKDKAIKQKITDILGGKEVEIPYDF